MSRTEEKLKYVDFTKNFKKLSAASCNSCKPNTPDTPSILPNPLLSSVETTGFTPSTRNMNYQNISNENNLLFGIVNRGHKEMIESDMPPRSLENFGSISSNEFESTNVPGSPSFLSYELNNDVLQQIVQEYDRVKDKGEFYTFKSTPRRLNVDLSSHMPPPQKTLGRGFGDVNVYEKIYLGEQTRSNEYRPILKDAERIEDVPYYLTSQPVFKNLGGDDTRYLNSKLR